MERKRKVRGKGEKEKKNSTIWRKGNREKETYGMLRKNMERE